MYGFWGFALAFPQSWGYIVHPPPSNLGYAGRVYKYKVTYTYRHVYLLKVDTCKQMVNRRTIIWLAHIWVPICSWWIWRTFRIKHANDCLLLNICSILHWADTTYVLKTELFFHPHRLHFWRNNKNIYWGVGMIHIKTIVTLFLFMNVVCTYKKWKKKTNLTIFKRKGFVV